MFLAEKPNVSGSLAQDAMTNWKAFWMFPSFMALAVTGIFLVTFFDKSTTEETSAAEQD